MVISIHLRGGVCMVVYMYTLCRRVRRGVLGGSPPPPSLAQIFCSLACQRGRSCTGIPLPRVHPPPPPPPLAQRFLQGWRDITVCIKHLHWKVLRTPLTLWHSTPPPPSIDTNTSGNVHRTKITSWEHLNLESYIHISFISKLSGDCGGLLRDDTSLYSVG